MKNGFEINLNLGHKSGDELVLRTMQLRETNIWTS